MQREQPRGGAPHVVDRLVGGFAGDSSHGRTLAGRRRKGREMVAEARAAAWDFL
jgi:hypothetical protein